jgi:CBS domain-containing protein
MLLQEVLTPAVVWAERRTRVLEAARLMRTHHVGDLVVVDDPGAERAPLGIVTDRDLVVEVLAGGLDPAATTLGSLLHRPVVIASESEDSGVAIERMRAHGVRRLPVVDAAGSLVGIVTLNDLLRLAIEEASGLLGVIMQAQRFEQHARRPGAAP